MIDVRRRSGKSIGFVEQWYVGNSNWQGIRVGNKDKLDYVMFIGQIKGFPLNNASFYGFTAQDKFYDESSFLVNGTIITTSKRREYFGRKESELCKIKVGETIPEQILTILAETQERVLATARMFNLPLEENCLMKVNNI